MKKIYYLLKNIRKKELPIGISIDVTNKCNLKCKHCYFHEQEHPDQYQCEDLYKLIRNTKMVNPSIIHASWVGGEPLLRKELIERGRGLFPFNMIVTNGTIKLPEWKNCVFNISVDGIGDIHDKIRGKGVSEKIKHNIINSNSKINLACVLNKVNYKHIPEILEEWKLSNVRGINFSFYTPIKGIEEDLWLDWTEREQTCDELIGLKGVYGGFIQNPKSVLQSMKFEINDCMIPKSVICLDSVGKMKLPCVIGEKADCLKCGCLASYMYDAIIRKNDIRAYLGNIWS